MPMFLLDLLIGAFVNFNYFKLYVISLCTDQQSVANWIKEVQYVKIQTELTMLVYMDIY